MADTKNYFIKINGVDEAYESIIKLKDVLESMDGATKNGSKGIKTLTDEEIRATQATKEHAQEVREQTKLEKARQTIEEGSQNTYKEKQKLLTALGTVIKNTNAQTDEENATLQEQIQQYSELNKELKDFDAVLGNHQRNVGDYAIAGKSLKSELKDISTEMANLAVNGQKDSERYQELAQKAGQYRDALSDASAEINRFASDTAKLDSIINIAQTASSAFGIFKSTMVEFGLADEEALQSIEKLNAVMAQLQSLKAFQEAIESNTASGKLLREALDILSGKVSLFGKATSEANVQQQALSTSQKVGATTSRLLTAAMNTIPIMLLVSGIALLITHASELWDWFRNLVGISDDFSTYIEKLRQKVVGIGNAVVQWFINPWKTAAKVLNNIIHGEFKKAGEELVEGFKNQFNVVKNYQEGVNGEIVRQNKKKNQEILKSEHKATQDQLDELKARKGNSSRYSKEEQELMKKSFEQRKKIYANDKEELRKIKNEELAYWREVEESKTKSSGSGSKSGSSSSSSSSKSSVRQQAEDDYKVKVEFQEKYASYIQKLVKATNDDNISLSDAMIRDYDKRFNEILEKIPPLTDEQRDFLDDLEKSYNVVYKNIYDAKIANANNAYNTEKELSEKQFNEEISRINQYSESEEERIDRINTLHEANNLHLEALERKHLGEINDIYLEYQKNTAKVRKQFDDAVLKDEKHKLKENRENLNEELADFTSYTAKIKAARDKLQLDMNGGLLTNNKQIQVDIANLNLLLSQYRAKLGESENIVEDLIEMWDSYLDGVKKVYGTDSKEFEEAQKAKQDAINAVNQTLENQGNLQKAITGDLGLTLIEPFSKLRDLTKTLFGEEIPSWAEASFQSLSMGLETFTMALDLQVEMARVKFEEVSALYDTAMERVSDSEDRIQDLQSQLKDSTKAEKKELKKQLADEEMLLAQRNAEAERLNQEKIEAEKQLAEKEKKQKKAQLAVDMAVAISNSASGAAKALSQFGFPLGPVFAAIMTALGMAQVAIIGKQMSMLQDGGVMKFADGGLLEGKSHKQGGIPVGNTGIEVEGGEFVVNKKATAKNLELLEAINNSTLPTSRKHHFTNRFAEGGQIDTSSLSYQNNEMANLMSAMMDNMNQPQIVTVVDYNKVSDRLTRVKQYSGIKG